MGNIISYFFPNVYFKYKIETDIEMNDIVNEVFFDDNIFIIDKDTNFRELKLKND